MEEKTGLIPVEEIFTEELLNFDAWIADEKKKQTNPRFGLVFIVVMNYSDYGLVNACMSVDKPPV